MSPHNEAAHNAAELLEELHRKTGRFRELTADTVWCPNCTGKNARRLVQAFVGPDESGDIRTWILTAARSIRGRKVPAQCQQVTRSGEAAQAMLATCSRCRGGYVVFPAGIPVTAAPVGCSIAFRYGPPARQAWAGGDQSEIVQVIGAPAAWIDPEGAGPVVLLPISAPTLGIVGN